MPRLTCPDCDEVVKVPDGQVRAKCPACGRQIGKGKGPLAEEPDESDEEEREEERPLKRRRKPPQKDPLRGVIPLVLLGPVGIALAVGAVVNVKVAVAGVIVGFIATCAATLALYSLYKREGAGHMTGDQSWGMFFAQIQLAFSRPRTFGSWKFLELLFGIVMLEGFTLVVILPKIGIHPHAEAQKAAAEQPQGAAPNPPAGVPNNPPAGGPNNPPPVVSESDRAINQALADLDKNDGFARMGAARQLKEMKPKADRRAEVVEKLNARLNDDVVMSRTEVIRALGVWGGPEDVPVLVRLLDDPEAFTREAAVQAVTRFKDPRAIPGLIRCLNGVPARAANQALVEIGSTSEKDLIQEISKKESESMAGAIDVLKVIGSRASLPALRAIVNDPDKRLFVLSAQEAIKSINARIKK